MCEQQFFLYIWIPTVNDYLVVPFILHARLTGDNNLLFFCGEHATQFVQLNKLVNAFKYEIFIWRSIFHGLMTFLNRNIPGRFICVGQQDLRILFLRFLFMGTRPQKKIHVLYNKRQQNSSFHNRYQLHVITIRKRNIPIDSKILR